jgi:glucokinase
VAVIAVDCGGTNLTVAHARSAGAPEGMLTVPTPAQAAAIPSAILALMALLPPAESVGVGVAGLVDHETGRLVWMPHRPGSAAIADEIVGECGLPTVVDNDANATALAEAVGGAGRGYRTVLGVTVGTGIGGGLVVDGVVERGRGHLGEIGHISCDPGGPRCVCGRVGCWEEVASGRTLDRAARAMGLSDGTELARRSAGDRRARDAVRSVGEAFGRGLADLVAILDPDVIVVGGGMAAIGEEFLGPARRTLAREASGGARRRPTPVLVAEFGPAAGIVGAALMAGAPL